MIRRKLKTLNNLKRKIMDELNLNPAWYEIKIIYRYPQEVLHEWINYGCMAIKEDKHVKIMFNRIHKMPQVIWPVSSRDLQLLGSMCGLGQFSWTL